jgi:hypothetical protein
MSLANKKKKDSAMAQLMKRLGIERSSCNCPICHSLVSLNRLYFHLGNCGK